MVTSHWVSVWILRLIGWYGNPETCHMAGGDKEGVWEQGCMKDNETPHGQCICYTGLCFYCASSHFLVILCWPIHGGHLMGAALPGMLSSFLWWGHIKFLWAVYSSVCSRNWFCWRLSKHKWNRNILLFKGQTKYYMPLLACKL